jgi:hypothetical protein
MACYFTRIHCASSGTKRRTQGTEEKQPVAARRKRYCRPVLPASGTTALSYRSPQAPPTEAQAAARRKRYRRPVLPVQAVLPVQRPVLPDSGTTAPSYRSPQAPSTTAPGPQAVLPLPERYYRSPPVLPVAGPVLPGPTDSEYLKCGPVPCKPTYNLPVRSETTPVLWLDYI